MHRRDRENCSSQRQLSESVAFGLRSMRSRSDRAMLVSSSHEEGGACGVWLRPRILNSLVFSLRTTVRAIRSSLRGKRQSVRVYDHSGRGRFAAERFASVLNRRPLRMSFFRMLGVRSLRPYSKQPGQKNDRSIYRALAVDRAPLPSLLARMRPGTRANGLWSKPVPTRRRLEEYPLGSVSPRAR
jgi:hypothetical protein